MNQDPTSSWPHSLHEDPMVSAPGDDEFSNFLEFGLNFSGFDADQQHAQSFPQDGGSVMDANGTHMDTVNALNDPHQNGHPHPYAAASQPGMDARQKSNEALMDVSLQAQSLQQHQHHQQHMMQHQNYRQPVIPPTPNSIEMHGGAARYYQQMDMQSQAIYDRYHGSKDDQMAFTPLVSPAVTPVDTHFRLPEFTIPGEYFSPLTSPALEAKSVHPRQAYHSAQSSDSGMINSPLDGNVDLTSLSNPGTPVSTRKPRRKLSASSRTPARGVGKSPMVKGQARRKQATSAAPVLDETVVHSQSDPMKRLATSDFGSHDSSAGSSISPEPLSEALIMPPPAAPRSTSGKSPQIPAQNGSPALTGNEAATPATLMRLSKSQSHPTRLRTTSSNNAPAPDVPDEVMEDMMLPEAAATGRPKLSPIDTAAANEDQSTPTLSANKTPKLAAGGTPGTTATNSVAPSPQLLGMTSPPENGHKRTDSKGGGRGSKKRQSASSSQVVSPALRPKISPSIKPLIREGVSAETSALFLASKSNYQNILEGTHLPGVSYPEALAENLSSKRTSHKIAEQGRRNRINMALKEIEGLLPPSTIATNGKPRERSGSNEEGEGKAGGPGNSKASTVEMAIVYIKELQKELGETKAKLQVAETKLADGGSSTQSERSSD